MIRILTIIGARPQFIKAAAISREIQQVNRASGLLPIIEERILHTGQHYDANMSEIFFEELGIPKPYYRLKAGSGHHGEQTAKMIEGIEKVLLSDHFDGVLVYGDTNSTLAGSLAASKLNIPVFHVEAGLRSYNMSMPEEINRILCDQVSSLLFAPTQVAIDNLAKEGLLASPAQFLKNKERKVILSGDVMYDNSLYFATLAEQKSAILSELSLQKWDFILATIHRANNTDNAERLSAIFEALLHISEFKTVVLPLHPRTRKQMEVLLSKNVLNKVTNATGLKIIPPASFLDMILLEKQASMVITDSGGVQKEAFFFEKPCLILRSETEWVEILQAKAGMLVDADVQAIVDAYHLFEHKIVHFPPLFGDGMAASKIVRALIEQCS